MWAWMYTCGYVDVGAGVIMWVLAYRCVGVWARMGAFGCRRVVMGLWMWAYGSMGEMVWVCGRECGGMWV